MLLAGAIASIVFGRYGDAAIIGLAIMIDATLSFAQVFRTEKTLEKLREQIQPTATVLREGKTKIVPVRELVVGDIIEISAGEKVPADGRVIESRGLKMNEASLTGESGDNEKTTNKITKRTAVSNRRNVVYMGTVVSGGSGRAVVTAVGIKSELGKIAQILRVSKSPASPLNRQLQRTGVNIGIVIVVAIVMLAIVGIWTGMNILETTITAITLIVSAVPEDLTMILTIALTIGVARILRYRGAVKELSAGETLGSATVICTDKTGTITYGEMRGDHFDTLQGETITKGDKDYGMFHRLVLTSLAIANDSHRVSDEKKSEYIGNATERAALEFAERCGLNQVELKKSWVQRDAISFNRQWKYRATLNDHPTQATRYLFVNGAPEVLLAKSCMSINEKGELREIDSSIRFEMQQKIEGLAREGNRLLGVAVRRNVNEKEIDHTSIERLVFLGVLVIKDPVRSDVKKVIARTEDAGIAVKIVTGDHMETARSIAREVGIVASEDSVMSSDDIQKLTDVELEDVVEQTTIFARVTPLDKQRIVKALQAKGHVVAMTGDGVNDAVALKSADIGVAMGSGKDIAKEAADLILLDDNFKIIVRAVEEGRVLRDNIRKVLGFLLAHNAAEVAIFFVGLMMGVPLPLLPAQILWINLVTDGTSDIALALEPKERNVMKRKPDNPQSFLSGRDMVFHIVYTGSVVTMAIMAVYLYTLKAGQGDLIYARTMAFTFLSMVSLLSVWSFRSLDESILSRGFWGNKWVPVSLAVSASLHMLAVYVPQLQNFFSTMALGLKDWALIIMIALVTVMIVDLRKGLLRIMIRKWPKLVRPAFDRGVGTVDINRWEAEAVSK
jgi:Ca2+-transporting ATPase